MRTLTSTRKHSPTRVRVRIRSLLLTLGLGHSLGHSDTHSVTRTLTLTLGQSLVLSRTLDTKKQTVIITITEKSISLKSEKRRNRVSMENKRKDKRVQVLIVAVLVESIVFAGTILYYNNAVTFRDSELVTLHGIITQQYNTMTQLDNQLNSANNEIANLQSNLQADVAQLNGTLNSVNLQTALGITEVPYNSASNNNSLVNSAYNHLFISGSVTNEGLRTAYNAGLSVVAYDINNALVVNMTVPLTVGTYEDGVILSNSNSNSSSFSLGSLTLESLNAGQTASINIAIYHEGTAATWKVIPVWTNSP